jgi:hypothetical protein
VKSSLVRVKLNNSKSSNLNILKTQYIKIDECGHKFYYKDREMTILHREDGPAVEWSDGGKYWYLDGKRHRKDGPAAEGTDGTKEWYLDGKLHREDGPAIEWDGGPKEWYLDGKQLTEEEHAKRTVKEVVVSMDQIAKLLGVPVEKLKISK